ncbi:MAG: hypothetical protein JO185_13890 [Acidobacteriaceae bacterium]|nr:hypothetical protein [Acidobacteriaceae bacterium]
MSTAPALSERRLAANRANAQWSTGPQTPEGKAKSSLNAVKTGLTGRSVLLPSEDAEAYETHLLQYLERFAPVGERETELVQSLADTQWRLNRIPGLEFGLFALGRMRYAERFAEIEDSQVRAALLDAHIFTVEGKHFSNLHRQEARLRRQHGQDLKELQGLQRQRQQEEEQTGKRATYATPNGFELLSPAKQPELPQSRERSDRLPLNTDNLLIPPVLVHSRVPQPKTSSGAGKSEE